MIKIDKLKTYIFEVVLLLILFFALFVLNNYSKIITAVILLLYAIIVCLKLKKRKIITVNQKQVIILMGGLAVLYVGLYYMLGLYFGYYDATVKFGIWSIVRFIIPLICIIISSEIIRYVFISQETKLSKLSVFMSMVLIDIIVYTGVYDITYYDDFLAIIGSIIFASISCNLLYNYICLRFGYKPIIIYRLITVLYIYIIPITPDIHIYFNSFIRMMYPYVIYLILEYTYAKTKYVVSLREKRKRIINTTIIIIVTCSIIMLISCQFKYGILVIGSGSMTGTINKGDAVVFESYEGQEIKEKDIIIFEKDKTNIVHRVIDIQQVNGQIRYYTKGDANEIADDGYITNSQIIGISTFKIKYIGKPTIWLRETFNK